VHSLINRALQVLSAPRDGIQEQPEDTTEDLRMALARTSARVDFAGHPLQDMWVTLQCVSRHTEQSQFELLQTVEGLCTLDCRLGRACMSAGGEHTVYIQPDQNIIPDGPYVLSEYEAIRLRNPPPDEELVNGVTPRMMALRLVKDEATDCAFRYAMRMNAVTGPPGPRPVVPFHLRTCFVVRAKVNGCEALTMVDTGSMANFVSPAFATIAKLAMFTLESQLPLQLGCVGSRSTITHGVHVPVCLGHVTRDTYFDVVTTMSNSGPYPVTPVALQLYSSTPVTHHLLRPRLRRYTSVKYDPWSSPYSVLTTPHRLPCLDVSSPCTCYIHHLVSFSPDLVYFKIGPFHFQPRCDRV